MTDKKIRTKVTKLITKAYELGAKHGGDIFSAEPESEKMDDVTALSGYEEMVVNYIESVIDEGME